MTRPPRDPDEDALSDALPPLDDDEGDPVDVGDDALAELDGDLDDAAMGDEPFEELGDYGDRGDDTEGEPGAFGEADEIAFGEGGLTDEGGLVDDPAELYADVVADDLPGDDGGHEGPERDHDDALDELPPLDAGDDDEHEEAEALSRADDPPEVDARVTPLRGEGGAPMVAVAMDAGPRALLVVGDRVAWALTVTLEDDDDASLRALDAPGDAVFGAAACASGALWVADLDGRLWRSSRAGAAWREVTRGEPDRRWGPLTLHATARGAWAVTARGALLKLDPRRAPEEVATPEPVSAASFDASGAAVVAGRTALWWSADGAGPWSRRPWPSSPRAPSIAHAGEHAVVVDQGRGWVSADAGETWSRDPGLDDVTALSLVATDDGRVRVVVGRASGDLAHVETATLGAGGVTERWERLARVAVAGEDDDDGAPRVTAVRALDPSAARVLALTGRGEVLLIARRSALAR